MPTSKLTKRLVESAQPPSKGQLLIWDEHLRGFGLCLQATGVRSYVVRYRTRGARRDHRMVIGRHGAMTVQEARQEARAILADVDRGADPVSERKAGREAPTVAELGELYVAEYATKYHKDNGHEARRKLAKNIVPLIGRRRVEDVTRADIERVHTVVSKRAATQANRTLAQLSGMFRLAEERGLREQGTNPCRFVKKNRELRRERFLSDAELTAYAKGLDEAERLDPRSRPSCDALRLILLTGARKSEILSLRWKYVDYQRALAQLPDSKTGQRQLRLPKAGVGLLKSIRRQRRDAEWVFPGSGATGHLTEVRKTHDRACETAGIQELRVHDLRHSFASVAVAAGHSLPVIGKALGHKRASTAERYSHLSADPVRHAVETTASHIAALMRGGESGG